MLRHFTLIPCAFLIVACVLGQSRADNDKGSGSSSSGTLDRRIEQKVKEAIEEHGYPGISIGIVS